MDKQEFIAVLSGDDRDYRNRIPIVHVVLENSQWILLLFEKMSEINDKSSAFSARILELACKQDLKVILAYLDDFSDLIPNLILDGSVRASAKIIELLTVEYFIKINPLYLDSLTDTHLERFTEVCFDWMISEKAVAIQAHSMYALYLLGHKLDWIHPELTEIIHKSLPYGSIGYQNRGKKVMLAIETGTLLKLY